jgi:hypothetical protein
MLTAINEPQRWKLVPYVLVYGRGNANPFGLCELFESRGDVDAVTKQVIGRNDHIADVDTNPKFD